jgi:DNA-directed RNA polymerase specialized sigma subunit
MSISQPITKERLEDYRNLIKEINFQEERLLTMRQKLVSIASPKIDSLPRSTSFSDKIATAIAIIDELERNLSDLIIRTTSEFQIINCEIDKLPYQERIVLKRRYFDGLDFETIADEIHYCKRSVYNIHNSALKKIEITCRN